MNEKQYREGIARMLGKIKDPRLLHLIYNFICRYYAKVPDA